MLSKKGSKNQMFKAHGRLLITANVVWSSKISQFRFVGVMWVCLLRKCPVLCLVVAPHAAAFNNYHSLGQEQPVLIYSSSDIDVFYDCKLVAVFVFVCVSYWGRWKRGILYDVSFLCFFFFLSIKRWYKKKILTFCQVPLPLIQVHKVPIGFRQRWTRVSCTYSVKPSLLVSDDHLEKDGIVTKQTHFGCFANKRDGVSPHSPSNSLLSVALASHILLALCAVRSSCNYITTIDLIKHNYLCRSLYNIQCYIIQLILILEKMHFITLAKGKRYPTLPGPSVSKLTN